QAGEKGWWSMRGQGRIYKPKTRGEPSQYWWLDLSVNGKRHRRCTNTADKHAALAMLANWQKDVAAGRPLTEPAPVTLGGYVPQHLAAKTAEVDERTGEAITARWLASAKRHLARAVEFFGEG